MVQLLRLFALGAIILLYGCPAIDIGSALAELPPCRVEPISADQKLRCNLWEICSYSRPLGETSDLRKIGPLKVGPNQWIEIELLNRNLDSSWPEAISLKFSEGDGRSKRLIEEIRDFGLNGLSPSDIGDCL